MNFKHLILLVVTLMATQTFAQQPICEDSTSIPKIAPEFQSLRPQLNNPTQSKVPIWLDFCVGANYADCFDKGTIPFRYTGFGANAIGGITIEWGRFHIGQEVQFFYNLLSNVNGSSTDVNLTTEFLYRFHDSPKNLWHYWVGGQLQTFVDMKDIPLLMNAASSVSLFGNLCATGMLKYDFAFNRAMSHHWLTAYGKLSLPIVGVVNRPGYAYIGNPTINENAWLESSDTFAKFFSGASTELGLYLNLCNDNRIGLSYRWDYLTTGKKGAYRYDNALHSINLSFMFRVN